MAPASSPRPSVKASTFQSRLKSSVTGIGSGGSLETDVNTLAAANGATGGNIEIDNVDAGNALLTLDTVGTLHGAVNTAAGGTIVITNDGAITVADDGSATDDVSADGDITLDAADPRVAGGIDNLIINANADIVSASGNITLEAGDDLAQSAGGLISAATGIITINVDLPSVGDPDGAPNVTGSTVTIVGSLTPTTWARSAMELCITAAGSRSTWSATLISDLRNELLDWAMCCSRFTWGTRYDQNSARMVERCGCARIRPAGWVVVGL